MNIYLRPINDDNRDECVSLKVTKKQSEYICTNEDSLRDAINNCEVARTFGIYDEDTMVGFTMLAFDEAYEDPDDRYWLWRFMIDEKYQGKGYGKEALKSIIVYFKENHATNIRLSTKESNVNAIALYKQFGFAENGEMNDLETVLELKF